MKENEQNIKREWSRNNLSEGEKLKKNWFWNKLQSLWCILTNKIRLQNQFIFGVDAKKIIWLKPVYFHGSSLKKVKNQTSLLMFYVPCSIL